MNNKFEFPQELVLGLIKSGFSFQNVVEGNAKEDYAVLINKELIAILSNLPKTEWKEVFQLTL